MNAYPVIVIATLLILIVILASVFIFYKRKGETVESDYRVFFILGLVWLPIGIASDSPGVWGMGAVFLIVGLANKDKWKEEKM